ncbi:MAG TPA: SET domain-containing protein-lysine N-methyltransferase [archaeon]|nr:SET domain-containing protein-lysine N-methyltransferase [archaeon]
MADVAVKKSKIHGMGVFASRNFNAGEIVIVWDISHLLTPEEARKLPEAKKKYIAHTNGKIILQQSPAKYINHSCDANTRVENFCDVAIRHIKKGEEITSNYSDDLGPGEMMKCSCGSKNCRKIIKSDK